MITNNARIGPSAQTTKPIWLRRICVHVRRHRGNWAEGAAAKCRAAPLMASLRSASASRSVDVGVLQDGDRGVLRLENRLACAVGVRSEEHTSELQSLTH